MFDEWSEWRRFPDPATGGFLTAPIGPGVYDLRLAAAWRLRVPDVNPRRKGKLLSRKARGRGSPGGVRDCSST